MNPLRAVASVVVLAGVVVACAKVPYTGRLQYNLVPDGIMRGVGKTTYAQMLSGARVERRSEDANLLSKVGQRISKVANEPKYEWEYSLIDDDTINAWCLPGGYIGFYTAILPVLDNEAGMAFVMGHEVAHATAHHGAERLSQQLTLIGGLGGLYLFMETSTELNTAQKTAILGAVGVGAELGIILPFSRAHESEADVIGMMYAASAGYPPDEGIALWDRMDAMAGGGGVPAFLSTHPSNDKRKEHMREWMPQARKRYARNKLPGDTTTQLWGRSREK